MHTFFLCSHRTYRALNDRTWGNSRNFSRSRKQFMPYSDCLLYNFVTEISQSALMFTPASENNSTFSLNDPVFTLKTEKLLKID